MKNYRKVTALLAATAMVAGSVVGCGGDTSASTSKESEVKKESTATSESTSTAVSTPVADEFSYPMDGQTITVWGFNPASAVYENLGDSYYIKNVEEAVGVDIEYTHPGEDMEQSFNFMIADADYADIIEYGWSYYPGGLTGAYEDGVAIELNDIIDMYMPNFRAWLGEHPNVDKGIKTDDGKYYAIPAVVNDDAMGCVFGWTVRQDILDQYDLEMPTTIDGWHDLLVTLKEELGITPMTGTLAALNSGAFINAYAPAINTTKYSVDAETGEVVYTGTTDGYREYLKTIAAWYKEGLIDKDIATNTGADAKAKILANDAVVSWGYAGSGLQTITLEGRVDNPDFTLVAVPGVAAEDGEEILYKSADALYGAGNVGYAVITTACEDVEAAARYLDWLFSEEGIMISNFGLEGETYTMVDGVPTYTEEITNNAEGKSVAMMLQTYVRSFACFPGVQTMEYLQGYYQLDTVKAAPNTWGKYGSTDYEVNALSFTADETAELSAYTANLQTEFDESKVKFVLGTLDVNSDADWNAYVDRMNALNLEDAVKIYAAAYERYLAR